MTQRAVTDVVPTAFKPSTVIEPGASLRALRDVTREHGFVPLEVEGVLPIDLAGTFYRTGPGLFSSFGRPYRHWFDGDGLISAVRFDQGRAAGASRLVQSLGLKAERDANRALYGSYGTPSPRGLLRRFWTSKSSGLERFLDTKNAANTSVLARSGRVFALYEGALPTEIDPATLETIGEDDFDGALARNFTAHPRDVPSRGASYGFAVEIDLAARIAIFELAHGRPARKMGEVPLPFATFVHDFVATERHLVFFIAPVRARRPAVLWASAASDALSWEPQRGTEIIVIPIDDIGAARRTTVDACFAWHFANAYERGGAIVVDVVIYPDFASNRYVGSLPSGKVQGEADGALTRFTIDLAPLRVTHERLFDGPVEFPTVSPDHAGRPHRFVWAAAHASTKASRTDLHDGLVRYDLTGGEELRVSVGEGCFPGEPVLVPKAHGAAEQDAWIVALTYDARRDRSHVAVIDAARPADGPVARAWFEQHIPPCFHGAWAPSSARVS